MATLALPLVALADCGSGSTNSFNNVSKYCDIKSFVAGALKAFVMLSLPIVAFFIVLSGFYFVIARGNPAKLTTAKWNFLYVMIGTCLVLGAWLLASLIGSTVTQITGS